MFIHELIKKRRTKYNPLIVDLINTKTITTLEFDNTKNTIMMSKLIDIHNTKVQQKKEQFASENTFSTELESEPLTSALNTDYELYVTFKLNIPILLKDLKVLMYSMGGINIDFKVYRNVNNRQYLFFTKTVKTVSTRDYENSLYLQMTGDPVGTGNGFNIALPVGDYVIGLKSNKPILGRENNANAYTIPKANVFVSLTGNNTSLSGFYTDSKACSIYGLVFNYLEKDNSKIIQYIPVSGASNLEGSISNWRDYLLPGTNITFMPISETQGVCSSVLPTDTYRDLNGSTGCEK